jgi:hypothetical protein
LSRCKGISVFCALSVETVLWLRKSIDQQLRAAAAHEQLRAIDTQLNACTVFAPSEAVIVGSNPT